MPLRVAESREDISAMLASFERCYLRLQSFQSCNAAKRRRIEKGQLARFQQRVAMVSAPEGKVCHGDMEIDQRQHGEVFLDRSRTSQPQLLDLSLRFLTV
jgi:hypothetical protein